MDMNTRRSRRRRRRGGFPFWTLPVLLCAVVAVWLLAGAFGGQPPAAPAITGGVLETPPAEKQPAASPSPSQSAPVPLEPGGETEDWRLTLVNRWNPLPEDYEIELVELGNGQSVDKRCYEELSAMLEDCRAAGHTPLICSSYRPWATQERLYTSKVQEFLDEGYTQARAEEEAGQIVAVPGTSEHQLGLTVDIVDISYQVLDREQEKTGVQKWLMEHCWEYGFILRYPTEKSEITGIIYEPWHYRYVGKETAQEIHRQDVCLEEYLEGLEAQEDR